MTPEIIINICLKKTGSWPDLVFSKSRMTRNVKTRQLIVFFMRRYTILSLQEIGNKLNIDHATVIHSITRINELDFNKWQPWFDYKKEIDKELRMINRPIIFIPVSKYSLIFKI